VHSCGLVVDKLMRYRHFNFKIAVQLMNVENATIVHDVSDKII